MRWRNAGSDDNAYITMEEKLGRQVSIKIQADKYSRQKVCMYLAVNSYNKKWPKNWKKVKWLLYATPGYTITPGNNIGGG